MVFFFVTCKICKFLCVLQICTRGRIHVMKYLHTEAMKEERKRGMLNDGDHRRNVTKPIHSSYVTVYVYSRLVHTEENNECENGNDVNS